MDSSTNLQLKINALDVIRTYRVPDLQALLEHARLSRQGNKSELFQRCKVLISSNLTPQLINKINQINLARINSSRPVSTVPRNQPPIVLTPTPSFDNLPFPQQIQYVHLPFFDKIRAIECTNMPVEKKTFSPLSFTLTDFDVDLILNGKAKVLLRIAPTIIHDKQNDVLPPYVFIQCNGQTVINNNIAKTVGSPAHSISFPTDVTDKLVPKSNVHNSLNYFWLQSPTHMSFKNLPKSYTLTIQLVRCISLENLIQTVLQREIQSSKKDTNDSDIEIEDIGLMTTQHRVSLICPITQALIVIPTKSSYCSHLTCFDLRSFLQMNERRLQWSCPLCKKPAPYDALHVDKRLQSILLNVPANCSTVEIDSSTKNLSDCQYILDNVKQEKTDGSITMTSHHGDDDDDDDDEDDEENLVHDFSTKSCHQSTAGDCVVLSSGSESEDEHEIQDSHTQLSDSPLPVTPLSTDLFTNQQRQIVNTNPSPNSIQSLPSLPVINSEDESYWEAIAKLTYDLVSNDNHSTERNQNRKRSNSSNSSLLSNSSAHRRQKRAKRCSTTKSQTSDIEVIILSSSDSSDNDDH